MAIDFDYIELPEEVRRWINYLKGNDVRKNTFNKQERWLLGRTTGQIWDYAKSHPLFTCPLYPRAYSTECKLNCEEKCGSQECWEVFRKWAITPLQKPKTEGSE